MVEMNKIMTKPQKKSITDIYLAWEKPEEHVAIKRFIDSKEAGVA